MTSYFKEGWMNNSFHKNQIKFSWIYQGNIEVLSRRNSNDFNALKEVYSCYGDLRFAWVKTLREEIMFVRSWSPYFVNESRLRTVTRWPGASIGVN